jgi:hypothetical protein
MMRATSDSGSVCALVYQQPDNQVAIESRSTTNGNTTTGTLSGGTGSSKWLRIARSGSSFTGSYSTDGSSWTSLGSVTISMPTDILMGMAVSSGDTGSLATATFANFSIGSVAGGITTYTYDLAGNRTGVANPDSTTDALSWDADGNMVYADVGGSVVSLTYNARRQRVIKETPTDTTHFRYDQKNLIQETDSSGDLTTAYTTTNNEYGDLVSEHDFADQGMGTGEFYQQFDAQHAANAIVDDAGSIHVRHSPAPESVSRRHESPSIVSRGRRSGPPPA